MNPKTKILPLSTVPFLAAAIAVSPSSAGANPSQISVSALNAKTAGSSVLKPQVSLAPAAETVLTDRQRLAKNKASYIMKVTFPLVPAAPPVNSAVLPLSNPARPVAAVAAAPQTATTASRPAPKSYATVREKVAAGVRVAAVPTAPRVNANAQPQERTTPATLGSRHRDRMLLAQLEADLQRSEKKLNRADADLTDGQRQLANFGNILNRAMLEAGPDAKGLHPFVKVAQRYAGTPYVWGGESRTGFDCSGFIIRVMRDLGYKALPHSAAEQFRYGLPVAQPLLKPGDLVFFANTYKPGISHVGIYLGKRRFIHAAGTGLGTIVSSLDAPKFQSKYAGARRLVAGGR